MQGRTERDVSRSPRAGQVGVSCGAAWPRGLTGHPMGLWKLLWQLGDSGVRVDLAEKPKPMYRHVMRNHRRVYQGR